MNVVKEIEKANQKELEQGVGLEGSWHSKYKDSAWIYVGGLDFELTEGDVMCVFSQYGEIVDCNLVRDKATGKSKGFAFICYADQRSTVVAVDNFNGITLCGRTLRVDHCASYRPPKLTPEEQRRKEKKEKKLLKEREKMLRKQQKKQKKEEEKAKKRELKQIEKEKRRKAEAEKYAEVMKDDLQRKEKEALDKIREKEEEDRKLDPKFQEILSHFGAKKEEKDKESEKRKREEEEPEEWEIRAEKLMKRRSLGLRWKATKRPKMPEKTPEEVEREEEERKRNELEALRESEDMRAPRAWNAPRENRKAGGRRSEAELARVTAVTKVLKGDTSASVPGLDIAEMNELRAKLGLKKLQ